MWVAQASPSRVVPQGPLDSVEQSQLFGVRLNFTQRDRANRAEITIGPDTPTGFVCAANQRPAQQLDVSPTQRRLGHSGVVAEEHRCASRDGAVSVAHRWSVVVAGLGLLSFAGIRRPLQGSFSPT